VAGSADADDKARLRAVPLFAAVDDARLQRLIDRSPPRTVGAGTVVAVREQPADRLIVVEAGALTAVHETGRGRRLRLGEFPAPCTVDKAAVLGAGVHTATWVAAGRSRLRFLPVADLLTVIDEVPAVRRHVLRHLAGQVRDRQEDLVRASFDDTASRVAAWLLRAASGSGGRVILPGAQEGLAEAIGSTRVSVNRALQALARDGLVRVEPGAVVILTITRLARRARTGDSR
jgi:CRP/FNR family transcriptional regulator, cyclic AMP receptor protein